MSFTAVEAVLAHSKSRGNDRLIMVVIAECADHDGANAWPAVQTIAKRANADRATVHRALKRLQESGELTVDYKAGPKGCNLYRVNLCATVANPPETVAPMRPEPSEEPSTRESNPPKAPPSKKEEASAVGKFYVETMKSRTKKLGGDDLRIIEAALTAGTGEELRTCIAACAASDFHMKRGKYANRKGGRYNSLGKIFKPRPTKGETQRSRIDWWLDQAEENGKSGQGKKRRYTRG